MLLSAHIDGFSVSCIWDVRLADKKTVVKNIANCQTNFISRLETVVIDTGCSQAYPTNRPVFIEELTYKAVFDRTTGSKVQVEWRGGVHIGEFFLVLDDPYVDYTTKRIFNWGVNEEYLQSF